MPFGLDFNFPAVGFLQFALTVGLGAIIIIVLLFYMTIFVWYFGKSMRKYLMARLEPNRGIIQEYIHENVHLKMAAVKDGEFTDLERPGYIERIPLLKKKWQFWKKSFKTIYHDVKPIVAQSIISINGVSTLMVWNVNPPLPDRYLSMLTVLTGKGYNSMNDILYDTQIHEGQTAPLITPETHFELEDGKQVKVEEFINLHTKVKSRNEIIVTPEDILGFSAKYMDEHAKKSVIEKEVTIQQKKATDKKYQTYAFLIILIMIIGGFIMLAWKIKFGGK